MPFQKNKSIANAATESQAVPLDFGHALVPVKYLSLEQTTLALQERVGRQETTWVLTLNWEMAALAEMDSDYATILGKADWVVPDGFPIALRLRWCGIREARHAERVAGVDLVASLLREIAQEGRQKIAIVGGTGLSPALANLGFPGHLIGFLFEDRVDPNDQLQLERLAKSLRESDARFIFLALGVPKQDRLALFLRERLPGTCLLGVGGTFDYLGGRKRRAPRWMQATGTEWLWRLLKEPRHTAKRYLLLYPAGLILFAWRSFQRFVRRADR